MPRPKSLVDRDEELRDLIADKTRRDKQMLLDYVGDRPLGAVKAPLDVQIANYLAIRNDPQWWGQLLAKQGQPGVPTLSEVRDYALKFERIVRGKGSGKQE